MAWVTIHTQLLYSSSSNSFCFQEESKKKVRKGGKERRKEGETERRRRTRKRKEGKGKIQNSSIGSTWRLMGQGRSGHLPPPLCVLPAWRVLFPASWSPNSLRIMQIHVGDLFYFLIEMQPLVEYSLLTIMSHLLNTRQKKILLL